MVDEYIVREPRQAQALLHPARLRIWLAFDAPKTSAQVARELGEPPNRIGHHVRRLLQLGLLVVCSRRGRRVFLERKARNLKIPFSLTPYSDLEEVMRLASAEILQLLRQAVVDWHPQADDAFLLAGEDLPRLSRSPVKFLDLTLTLEQVVMLEEMLRKLSEDNQGKGAGRRYRLGVILVPKS